MGCFGARRRPGADPGGSGEPGVRVRRVRDFGDAATRIGPAGLSVGQPASDKRCPGVRVCSLLLPGSSQVVRRTALSGWDGGGAVEPRTMSSTGGSLACGRSASGFSIACTRRRIPSRDAASKG